LSAITEGADGSPPKGGGEFLMSTKNSS